MFLSNWNRVSVFGSPIQFIDFLLKRGKLRLVYRAGIGSTSHLWKAEKDYDT
jgi:hypothetical protein